MSPLYLDASAITKLIIAEAETSALRSAVRDHTLVSNRVSTLEVTKAVARVDENAEPERLFAHLSFVELTPDLARVACMTGGARLRALDAIHVASAVMLGPGIDAFITYDKRQAAAARAAGLVVASPA
jgi:predicted nucleic acid-binding protein